MKVTNNIEKIHELKEIARKNMLGITDEDSDYICDNICDMLHTMYFVIDEWEKMKQIVDGIADLTKESGEE